MIEEQRERNDYYRVCTRCGHKEVTSERPKKYKKTKNEKVHVRYER